jgi:hypothetical protein
VISIASIDDAVIPPDEGVDRAPLTPETESLAPPLHGPKHAPFARFRVLLLVVRDSKAQAPRRGLLHSMVAVA